MQWLANYLIRRAQFTPYSHLTREDGSAYMLRYWLVPYGDPKAGANCGPVSFWRRPLAWLLQRFGIAVRVHKISAPDRDRHLHDHPWSFVSVVLRGWYHERRPLAIRPCFDWAQEYENSSNVRRRAGDICFRRSTDRHRISSVSVDCWTLFITFRMRQWWGFYTPEGKVYWRDYESVHAPIVFTVTSRSSLPLTLHVTDATSENAIETEPRWFVYADRHDCDYGVSALPYRKWLLEEFYPLAGEFDTKRKARAFATKLNKNLETVE